MRVAERHHGTLKNPMSPTPRSTTGCFGVAAAAPPGPDMGGSYPQAVRCAREDAGVEREIPRTPQQQQQQQQQQPRHEPPIGPAPLHLSGDEVDELYDLLSTLLSALEELDVPHVLIGGSLLGAVRSQSILFNDDDVDVAIVDDACFGDEEEENECGRVDVSPYERVVQRLPAILERAAKERNRTDADSSGGGSMKSQGRVEYSYQRRPWLACDRVKSTAAPRVWIDVFVLRQYRCRDDMLRIMSKNEEDQDANKILSSIEETAVFPLYHFDNLKAIELWPREYFLKDEIFPIRKEFTFGPLRNVSGPRMPLKALRRFFGHDCFTHYVRVEYSRGKIGDFILWQEGEKIPLSEEQYLPVQHSRRNKRIWSDHSRQKLESYISNAREDQPVENTSSGSSDMTRSKTFRLLSKQKEQESQPSKDLTKSFGSAVRQYTASSSDVPTFDKALRDAMEQHIAKARLKREESRQQILGANMFDKNDIASLSIASNASVPYPSIRTERPFLFDVDTYPLHQILADTIGVEDLSMMHEHPIKDKRVLMDALLRREIRRAFHECYDNFVTSFCIPLLHSLAMTQNIFTANSSLRIGAPNAVTYRYQAFPCIRVVRPGEFSIGPHCDAAYGHSVGNINFHIPLTPTFGTNALYTESHPGREDWHPLSTKANGLGYVFDGARCLHFGLENTTDRTRVSIDFRIAISRCRDDRWPSGAVDGDHGVDDLLCSPAILQDRYASAGPGYYEEAVIHMGGAQSAFTPGPVVVKKNSTRNLDVPNPLVDPDKRVGFPFI